MVRNAFAGPCAPHWPLSWDEWTITVRRGDDGSTGHFGGGFSWRMAQSGKQSSFLLDHRVHDEEVEDTGKTSQQRLVASNMVLMGLWRRHYFWTSRHQMPLAFR